MDGSKPSLDRIKAIARTQKSFKSFKIICISLVLITLSLIVFWPYLMEFGLYFTQGTLKSQLQFTKMDLEKKFILNPRFIGGGPHPYTVTAHSARQLSPSLIKLTKVNGRLSLKDGSAIVILADESDMTIDEDKKALLKGNVNFLHSNADVELWTEAATVRFKDSIVEGSDPVQGESIYGALQSRHGFFYDQKREVIHLKGPAEVILYEKGTP